MPLLAKQIDHIEHAYGEQLLPLFMTNYAV